MIKILGKAKRIKLRDIWKKEDKNFTKWLAEADNLELLGEAIGMSLELKGTEIKVGSFSADIVCKNNSDESPIVIENQLEKTDHDHLGKAITYGAGLDALTMIWVTPEFRKEHRTALKWLNENTNDKIHFFGIEIELFQIGASLPAPKFNIVCHPTDWRKPRYSTKQKASKKNKSSVQDNGLFYWQEFQKYLKSKKSKLSHMNPCDRHWQRLTIRVNRVQIDARINKSTTKISVELNLEHRTLAKTYFKHLEKDRKAIEKEIGVGVKLEWRNDAKNLGATIIQVKEVDPKNWKKQHAWLKERMETFEKVFKERMQDIAEEVKNN